MTTTPAAGDILNAADALQGPQQTYTRDEVALLLHLAYLAGQTATADQQAARIVCSWEDRPHLRRTYEQQVADELAEMEHTAQIRAARDGRPYRVHPGGPVDWETGEPVRHLKAAA